MSEKIWKAISYFLHPVMMPTIGFILLLTSDPYIYTSLDSFLLKKVVYTFIPAVFLGTAIVPMLLSGVLLMTGQITSIVEPNEQDRKKLIAFSELGFLLVLFYFHKMPAVWISLYYFILGINISAIVTLITSLFTRISLHAVGISGLVGTMIGLMYLNRMNMFPLIASLIGLAIIIGIARYKLKAHHAADIYIGCIVGMGCQALVFILGAR